MKSELLFNEGLGFFPVSMFVCLDGNETIGDIYTRITRTEIHDVIFCKEVGKTMNYNILEWVVPRLLSELYFVSLIVTLPNKIPDLVVGRLIVKSDFLYIKKLVNRLKVLSENDILLLSMNNIDELRTSKDLLIKNKLKCRLMFNSSLLSDDSVINAGIYDVIPYSSCSLPLFL